MEKVIKISGVIGSWYDEISAEFVRSELEGLGFNDKAVFHIDTPGGEVIEALGICSAISMTEAQTEGIVMGVCASAGVPILSCMQERKITEYSAVMIHSAKGYAFGTPDEMRSQAEAIEKLDSILDQRMPEITGLTLEEYRERFMDGKDHWLTPEEVEGLNLAKVIKGANNQSKNKYFLLSKMFNYGPWAKNKITMNKEAQDQKAENEEISRLQTENEKLQEQVEALSKKAEKLQSQADQSKDLAERMAILEDSLAKQKEEAKAQKVESQVTKGLADVSFINPKMRKACLHDFWELHKLSDSEEEIQVIDKTTQETLGEPLADVLKNFALSNEWGTPKSQENPGNAPKPTGASGAFDLGSDKENKAITYKELESKDPATKEEAMTKKRELIAKFKKNGGIFGSKEMYQFLFDNNMLSEDEAKWQGVKV